MTKIIIQKIEFDISLKKADTRQQNATDYAASLFYNKIQPELLDKLDVYDDNSVLRIDKIELDLGAVSEDKLTEVFARELSLKLLDIEALQIKNNFVFNANSALTGIEKSSDQSHLQGVLYFLSNGTFPWHFEDNNFSFSPDVLLNQLLLKNNKEELKEIIQLLLTNQTAMQRFVLQFDVALHIKLMALSTTTTANIDSSLKMFIKQFIILLKKEYSFNQIQLYSLLMNELINGSLFVNFSESKVFSLVSASKILDPSKLLEIQGLYSNKKMRGNKTTAAGYHLKQLAKDIYNLAKDSSESNVEMADEVKDSLYVKNAGIVILFPFLATLFEHLNLTTGGAFKDKKCQVKAVQVMHYLTYGSKKTQEHLLQLNKLLCYFPLDMPVPASLKITKQEQEECEEMLSTVLQHWSALKSSSLEGLRQTFFQRNGSLRKDGNDWILTVEKKGFDILLEHIPWSFRLVKLPWNKYIIHVDW